MKQTNLRIFIGFTVLLAITMPATLLSQSLCDTTAINAHLNPAGFTRLYVPGQPCSMYYYNPTPMYGIDAHRQALDLGVPQVVIDDMQEDTNVYHALFTQGIFPTNYEIWLGINDSSTTFTWRQNYNGRPAPAFTNWLAGEPNNLAPSCRLGSLCIACLGADAYWCANGEDCAVMGTGGQWLDITCKGTNITRIAVLELNTCPVLASLPDTSTCAGNAVQVTAAIDSGGTAPYTYQWNPGSLTGATVSLGPLATDTVTVLASDRFNCTASGSFVLKVNPKPIVNAGPDVALCPGASDTIGTAPDSGYSYIWVPSTGLSSSLISNPTIGFASNSGPAVVSSYVLTGTFGPCSSNDTVVVTLYPSVSNQFSVSNSMVCGNSAPVQVNYSGTASGTATYNWDFDSASIISGSGAGAYLLSWPTTGVKSISLSVIDHGCSDTPVYHTVHVFPKPIAVISDSGFVLSTGIFSSYQWIHNGTALAGDTTKSLKATSNGLYQVVVIDSNGCSDTSAIDTVRGLAVIGLDNSAAIRVYPNPSSGEFTITGMGLFGAEIVLTDPTGRIVLHQTGNSNQQQVQAGNIRLAAGEYYLSIKTSDGVYTSRIAIVK